VAKENINFPRKTPRCVRNLTTDMHSFNYECQYEYTHKYIEHHSTYDTYDYDYDTEIQDSRLCT